MSTAHAEHLLGLSPTSAYQIDSDDFPSDEEPEPGGAEYDALVEEGDF
jgi:hypothetical protein